MCALALANFVWNRLPSQQVIIKSSSEIKMRVDYYSIESETYKTLYYKLYNYQENSHRDEFLVNVVRQSGGINCQMRVRRNSLQEGAIIKMTHGQQHVAGLMEEFSLYQKSISGGRHHNSQRYTEFSGNIDYKDRLTLTCGLRVPGTQHVIHKRYDLEIENSLADFPVIDLSGSRNVQQRDTSPQESKQPIKLWGSKAA